MLTNLLARVLNTATLKGLTTSRTSDSVTVVFPDGTAVFTVGYVGLDVTFDFTADPFLLRRTFGDLSDDFA